MQFDFKVVQNENEDYISVEALQDTQSAKLEAIGALSDILRDEAEAGRLVGRLVVIVSRDGMPLFTIEVTATSHD